MVLSFSDAINFKNEIQKHFGIAAHFHDSCGGQYFSLDKSNDTIRKFIVEYFAKLNLKAAFSDNGLQFSVSFTDLY